MSRLSAPSDGKNVTAFVPAPVVERATPTIKRHVYLVLFDGADRSAADQLRILLVDRLQLLANLKKVGARAWRFALEYLLRRHFGPIERLEQEHGPGARVHPETLTKRKNLMRFSFNGDAVSL